MFKSYKLIVYNIYSGDIICSELVYSYMDSCVLRLPASVNTSSFWEVVCRVVVIRQCIF